MEGLRVPASCRKRENVQPIHGFPETKGTLSEAGTDPILFSWPVANLFIASKLIRKLAHHFNEKLPILKQKI